MSKNDGGAAFPLEVDWSKAPEGFDFNFQAKRKNDVGGFYKSATDRFINEKGSYILYADMGELVDLFHISTRPEVVVWNGSSLPPVGTVCEMHIDDGDFWVIGKVIAHAVLSDETVAVAHNESEVFHGSAGDFRPIRTPEQIAIEIRSKAITQLMCDLDVPTAIATRAYDAGYRKIEIVEGE